MSTKVWTAYRLVDNTKLWEVIHDIRVRATENAKKVIKEIVRGVIGNLSDTPEASEVHPNKEFAAYLQKVYGNTPNWDGKVTRYDKVTFATTWVREQYRSQVLSSFRDTYDFNSWVTVRAHDGIICLIPGSDMEMSHIFDFMKEDPRLKDWHYQNQVDDPAQDRDPEDWEQRRAFYEAVTTEDKWQDKLILTICDLDHYTHIDPWLEMVRPASKKEKTEET